MILKVYIRKHLFHLPRDQEDLTEMIKEKFYRRKPLEKSGFPKLYRISDIENENIKFEKNVNIFLINLYLLTLEHRGELQNDNDILITLSDENILSELCKMLDDDLEKLSIEEIEKKVINFITVKKSSDDGSVEKGKLTTKKSSVEFNIGWVRAMDKKLRE